jgi:hypothetical protein
MSEPTWLEQVRADLTAATTPIAQPMDGVIRQQAMERLLGVHVPALITFARTVEDVVLARGLGSGGAFAALDDALAELGRA